LIQLYFGTFVLISFFSGLNVIGKVEKDVKILEKTIEVGLSVLRN